MSDLTELKEELAMAIKQRDEAIAREATGWNECLAFALILTIVLSFVLAPFTIVFIWGHK